MMRRRMAQMNARMNAGMSGGGVAAHAGGKDTSGASSAPAYNSGPAAGNMSGKPGGPNPNVLDAVKKVMKKYFWLKYYLII